MRKRIFIAILFCLLGFSCIAHADSVADPMSDPFGYFSVYSLGNIGSDSSVFGGGNIDGVVGAAGDVYLGSISLMGQDAVTGYALHTGRSATLEGRYGRGVEIGQNLTINGLSIDGDVRAGGNVSPSAGAGGSISGSIYAAGTIDPSNSVSTGGQKQSGTAYRAMVDHVALSIFFDSTSQMIGGWEDTASVSTGGDLILTGQSGVNVVTIDASTLTNAWQFTINAPEDAIVYINVVNDNSDTVALNYTRWVYSGGISAGNVLLNILNTETLALVGGNNVNILAPNSNTIFYNNTYVTGSLIAGSITGKGSVFLGHFTNGGTAVNPEPMPEPATLLLILAGFPLLWRLMRATRQA